MLRKIKNFFLYAGVDQASFDRIKPKIYKANLTMTTLLSLFATVLIAVLLISSFSAEGIKQNKIVYLFGLILSLAILITSTTVAKKYYKIIIILVYLSYSIYYMYGILIGTITDPNEKTVTFMVMLVLMPILFIDHPMHIITVTCIYVTIFIILCFNYKNGNILTVDIIDAIVFGILGSSCGCVVDHMKIRGYTMEQKLKEISRIDQLTQMRNRNAFEFERDSIPSLCKHTLAIIYIDVNGLHEINNEEGHDFGDEMLKYVATEIKDAFSVELTYRLGGDEFVAFIPDKTDEEIDDMLDKMIINIEIENYHVAIGYHNTKIRHLNLDNLINTAEKRMLDDKKRYYKNIVNRESR